MGLSVQTILERNRLFRGLPDVTIRRIAVLASRRTYAMGGVVFSQGDPGDALFGVATGRVRISAGSADGREVFLNILEPGDTFGEIALLDGQSRTASATAIAPTELFTIAREPFLALVQGEPGLVTHLFGLLCQRIRWTSGLAEESALLGVPARLARRLLSLGKLQGRAVPSGIEIRISQEEVARFTGLSRQVVNQYLQDWKARRWVELGRGKIRILDDAALAGVIAGSASGD